MYSTKCNGKKDQKTVFWMRRKEYLWCQQNKKNSAKNLDKERYG